MSVMVNYNVTVKYVIITHMYTRDFVYVPVITVKLLYYYYLCLELIMTNGVLFPYISTRMFC